MWYENACHLLYTYSNYVYVHLKLYTEQNFERMFFTGELEVELVPQGTIAARLRAAGNGMPAIFTPAGAGEYLRERICTQRYTQSNIIDL